MLFNRFKLKYNFNNKKYAVISHSIGIMLLIDGEKNILKLICLVLISWVLFLVY